MRLSLRDGSGDRAVAQVDLKRAFRRSRCSEAQRHVHLDELAEADLAGGLRVWAGSDDLGVVGFAGERILQIVARRQRAPDQAVIVGVDDFVVRVPDLDPREVLRDRARAQLLVQSANARGREARAQVLRREVRLDPEVRDDARGLGCVGERARDDLRLQNARQHEAEHHHRQQAQQSHLSGQPQAPAQAQTFAACAHANAFEKRSKKLEFAGKKLDDKPRQRGVRLP